MAEIIILLGEYILCCFFFKNSALGMIDKIRTNSRLYPKYYVLPSKCLRKYFGLKKSKIPNYLYYRLYISLVFCILAPITTVVCLCTEFNIYAIKVMIFAPCLFVIPDTIFYIILSNIYKKK